MSTRAQRGTQYRLVSYVPNPFAGSRVTVGAVIRSGDGTLSMVPAPKIPDAACVGGDQQRNSFVLAHRSLDRVSDFDSLPIEFGPQILLSDPLDVPSEQAQEWVRRVVFPAQQETALRAKSAPRPRPRAHYGEAFFETRGLRSVLKTNYRPPNTPYAPRVTHYVEDAGEVRLLLEPLSYFRLGKQLEKDLEDVNTRFHAYRDILGPDRQPAMIAYLLAGFTGETLRMISDGLGDVARIVDLGDPEQEHRFVTEVRQAAGLGPAIV